MAREMKCLLCDFEKVVLKEKYDREELAHLWLSTYPNVRDELKLDEIHLYQCPNCKLKFFDPRLAGGDRFYSELGKEDWYYLHPGKTEYDYVQKYIQSGNKILDIGAGRGVLFTKIKANVEYTGLELSTKAVQLAKESGLNVKQEDVVKHAQDNRSHYDVVCLFQVLEHLTQLDSFLKSIHLTLKDGGLFVIAVPDNDGFISYTPNYTFNLPPHHTILWTEASLRYMAKKYNFDVTEVERELLQDVHREVAYKSYVANVIRRFLFLPNLLINNNNWYKNISHRVHGLYGGRKFERFIMPIVRSKQKYGQSIIITLRKK